MSQETCPVCGEELIPILENEEIKCKKCKSKIKIDDLGEIEQDKFQDLDRDDLIDFINYALSRIQSCSEEFRELESRIETLRIVVENSK